MPKYHNIEDRIRILSRLKKTPKDTTLDAFCVEAGISRRTLSRWVNSDATPFNLRRRSWRKGVNPISMANLNRGDAGKSLARKHGARAFVTSGYLSCAKTCPVWSECNLRDEGSACGVLDVFLEAHRESILAQPQVDPERDGILVERVLRLMGALLMMDLHLYRSGYLLQTEDGGYKLNPTLSDRYLSFTAQVARMLQSLGMSPVSAKRFQDTGENLDVILRKVAEGK